MNFNISKAFRGISNIKIIKVMDFLLFTNNLYGFPYLPDYSHEFSEFSAIMHEFFEFSDIMYDFLNILIIHMNFFTFVYFL